MKKYIGLFARMEAVDTYIVMAPKLINSIIQSLSGKSAGSFSVYAAGVVGFWHPCFAKRGGLRIRYT